MRSPNRIRRSIAVGALFLLLSSAPARGQVGIPTGGTGQRVKDTVHNLSASGPGRIRAQSETEVCIFCHTPHGAGDVRPLWNRSLSPGPYQIYQSTSLKAQVGQPTGSSKLCLSCHDGTIALGNVLSRATPIAMGGSGERIPAGPTNLGTDLSDDHPISFVYPSTAGNHDLLPASAIVPPAKLDPNGEVQCISCHEPHDNSFGKFLVRSNEESALCRSCHILRSWSASAHAASSAVVTADVSTTLGADPTTLRQNACRSCHRPHGAGGRPWILHRENITATCLPCHRGNVAALDVQAQLSKISVHGSLSGGLLSIGAGGPYLEGAEVSCADCHNPHAAGSSEAVSAGLPASLARVSGVSLSGIALPEISQPHELCFRCHGDAPARVEPVVSRTIVQSNKRLQFQATNPSFHPVGNPGANPRVPSLLPPLTTGSVMTCGDCHDSDSSRKLGGAGPAGPHGSSQRPLLAQRYETADFSIESPGSYALCYRCHQRESILGNASFKEHRRHVVDQRIPCSACHDPHGISSAQGNSQNSSHLINFDRAIVFGNSGSDVRFVDLGGGHGQCFMSCHGANHNPKSY